MSLLEEALRRQRELENQRRGSDPQPEPPSEPLDPGESPIRHPSASASRPVDSSRSRRAVRRRYDIPDDPVPPALREQLRHAERRGVSKGLIVMPLVALAVFFALLYARRAVVQMGERTSVQSIETMELTKSPAPPVAPVQKPVAVPQPAPAKVEKSVEVVETMADKASSAKVVEASVAVSPATNAVKTSLPVPVSKAIAKPVAAPEPKAPEQPPAPPKPKAWPMF